MSATATTTWEDIALQLAEKMKATAVKRDQQGGTALEERRLLKESGLLKLLIPTNLGGLGGKWSDIVKIVQIFSRVDSSIGHLYGYHFVNLITAHLWGSKEQQQYYYEQTAKQDWFWGNAFNPVQIKLVASKVGEQYVLNGPKTFCTGSADSDQLIVSALDEQGELFTAIVPTNREGIELLHDWDNFGQRQTDSGTVQFTNVVVHEQEMLKNRFEATAFAQVRLNMAHFILNHLFLGIAEGAFEEMLDYTKTKTRPQPNGEPATANPIIQKHYGELYTNLEAARLLVERTQPIFDEIWALGDATTDELKAEFDNAVHTAKVFVSKFGIELTNRMFEVMGSRATASSYGYDRYWRNMRTMTLHMPVDQVLTNLGHDILTR